jgi:hypothetical protein
MNLVPEIVLTFFWFAFALSFSGVGAFFVHTFGFDARAVLIVIYTASIVMRVLGGECHKGVPGYSNRLLRYCGIGLSVVTILVSYVAVRIADSQSSTMKFKETNKRPVSEPAK